MAVDVGIITLVWFILMLLATQVWKLPFDNIHPNDRTDEQWGIRLRALDMALKKVNLRANILIILFIIAILLIFEHHIKI